MKKYRTEYDEKLKAFQSNLSSAESLTNIIPGLTQKKISDLFKRNSILLGKVDAGKVKRPAMLADAGGYVPQRMLANLDQIPNLAGDPNQFQRQVIAFQADCGVKLELAVGLAAKELEDLRKDLSVEIESNLTESERVKQQVTELLAAAARYRSEIEAQFGKTSVLIEQSSSLAERLDKVKARLSEYDGDGRRTNSIDRLVNSIRKKVSDLEEELEKVEPVIEGIRLNKASSEEALTHIGAVSAELDETNKAAKTTLGLASQAGLAKSYIEERSKLSGVKTIYTWVFYVGIVAMVMIAAVYVLPAFEKFAVGGGKEIDYLERTLILLIRSAILAPFVWAIVFTSNRLKRVETLEMDYAEKAAAALAYHGYKSEMDGDLNLLQRLKNGLLVRFSEHPERLLRKTPPKTIVESDNDHFKVSTDTSDVSLEEKDN